MPTILQLPAAQALSPTDTLPIDQSVAGVWTTGKVSLTAVSSYVQAAIGSAGYSITGLATVTTAGAADLVGISQSGADKKVTLANLLNGETIDQGRAASAPSDADTFWTGQGGNTMAVQTFAAVWTWIRGHLPSWKRPVVELSSATQLDGSVHNDAILVCSQPVTITPAFVTQGSGFSCTVINMSSGPVTLASGIITSDGAGSIAVGQKAEIFAATYSDGNIVYAQVSGVSSLAVPGQVTSLAAGAPATASVPLSWIAPSAGGAVATYLVQYKLHTASTWSNGPAIPASSISGTITGLTAATAYDFQVSAVNATGTGAASATVSVTTASAAQTPNVPTGLAVSGTPTASSISVLWAAPTVDSTHDAATAYTLRYSVSGAGIWTTVPGINATTYTVGGLAASQAYDFEVEATNLNPTPSAWTAVVTLSTAAAAPNQPTGLAVGTPTASGLTATWTASATDPTHSAATSYTVQWRTTGGTTWTQQTGVTGTLYAIAGLAAATQYDVQVQAVNSAGSSAFTATANGTTAVSSGTYAMGSGYQPYASGTTYAHTASVGANVSDLSVAADGGNTVPAAVYFGWSTSSTVAPTSTAGMTAAAGTFQNGGHQYWYSYGVAAPVTPGTYYFWAVETDAGGTIRASVVQNNLPITGGSPVAFTIT